MSYLPVGYLIALGEARPCLAALADSTDDIDLSSHYDHLLIELDDITDDVGPACTRMTGGRAELLGRLEESAHRLAGYGVDRLSLELLMVAASDGLALSATRVSRLRGSPTRRTGCHQP